MTILIADRIKTLRKMKNMTQTQLAKKVGVTRSSVNAWELGITVPSVATLMIIADEFATSIDYLLGIDHRLVLDLSALNEQEQELFFQLYHCLQGDKSQ